MFDERRFLDGLKQGLLDGSLLILAAAALVLAAAA